MKTALRNLVTDSHRRRQTQPRPLPADVPAPAAADDDEFLTSWREELLFKAWADLAETQPALNTVLRAHAERPDAPAAELAIDLAVRLGRPVTAGNLRVMLHRARAQFADLVGRRQCHTRAFAAFLQAVRLYLKSSIGFGS